MALFRRWRQGGIHHHHSDEVVGVAYANIAPRLRVLGTNRHNNLRSLRRTGPSSHFRVYILLTRSMSRITENSDCDDCNYPAHGGNDSVSRVHSTMDEDDELLRYIWTDYLHPKEYEWVLIVAYIVVFFVSLIGNSLGKWNFKLRSSLHSCVRNVAESLNAHFQITLRTNKLTYK